MVLKMASESLLAHHEHSFLSKVTHASTRAINFGGAMFLTAAFAIAVINSLVVVFNSLSGKEIPMLLEMSYSDSNQRKKEATFGRVRKQLGELTALGLEILVVADVMESLTQTAESFSWNSLGKMAAIAVFRTGLAIALGQEVKEIEEKLEEEELKERKHKKAAAALTTINRKQ